MPQDRAAIQKRYREKKKREEGERYLAKERLRQKENYVPVALLTKSAQKARNERTNVRVRKCRRNKTVMMEELNRREENPESPESSGYNSMPSTSGRLVVRVPNARRNGPRKRLSKALRRANDKLRRVISENITVRRKLKTLQRRVQRHGHAKKGPMTPRRKTETQLKSAGVNQLQASKIRKQLLLGNIVMQEMKEKAKTKDRYKKSQVYSTVAGKIVQKYNCVTKLSKELELNRNKLSQVIKHGVDFAKKRRKRVIAKLRDSVVNFLEREDNCRMQPGKKDATKAGQEKIQTRVLTDYMSNLHQKYISENPESKLSLATFCRMRPKYIHLTSCLSRNVCLCTKHQNITLKLQMMRKEGIDVPKNPETFIKDQKKVEKTDLPETVVYPKWKRVTLENNRKKMKIVTESASRDAFFEAWEKEVELFNEHYHTMKTQYEQTRILKDKLPEHEIVVHMDFAENYACKSAEEVTDAYYTTSQVTLHPIVAYYRHEDGHLAHKSFVAVSGDLSHNSSAVIAILEKFLKTELDLPGCDEVQYVHYWTDSPTSQYRNRFIFNVIANHEKLYGCPATWNYYEAGHGKNVCDGLGGTVKRLADEAVRAGKAVIQDAEEFMDWAVRSSMKEVKFFFFEKEDIAKEVTKSKSVEFAPVKGTLKIHSAKINEEGKFCSNNVSCYCETCLSGKVCTSWRVNDPGVKKVIDNVNSNPDADITHNLTETYTGSYVATVYDNEWYIAKVLEVDEEAGDMEVSYMQRSKAMFKWPHPEDKLTIEPSDILCKISSPVASGKYSRMFKLNNDDLEQIEMLFENRQ